MMMMTMMMHIIFSPVSALMPALVQRAAAGAQERARAGKLWQDPWRGVPREKWREDRKQGQPW